MMPMDYSGVGWKKKRKGAKIQISGEKTNNSSAIWHNPLIYRRNMAEEFQHKDVNYKIREDGKRIVDKSRKNCGHLSSRGRKHAEPTTYVVGKEG